jgi:hypothetical protein
MNHIFSEFLNIYKRDFNFYRIKYKSLTDRELYLEPNENISVELLDVLVQRLLTAIYGRLRKVDNITIIINYHFSKRLIIFREGELYMDSHSKIIGLICLPTIYENDLKMNTVYSSNDGY